MVDTSIKEPTDATTGTLEDLRTNAVDPLASIDASGHKPFLEWHIGKSVDDEWPIYTAYGLGNQVYELTSTEAPPAPGSPDVPSVTSVRDRG